MNSVKRKARTALTLAAAGLMIYTGSLVIKNVNESWKLKRNASQIESVLDNSELARNTLELYKESGKISPLDYSILKDKIDEREQEIKSWNKVSLYTYNYSDGEKLANSPSDQSAQNPEVESLESPKETPTTFKYNLGLTPREKSIELLGHEPTDEGRIDLEGKVLSGEYLGRFGFDRYVFQIETQIGNKEITYSNYADDYRADVVQSLARKGVYIKIPAVYEKWAVNQNLDNLSLNNYIDSNDNSKGTSETNIQTYIPEGIKYNVRQFLGKYDIGQLYTKEDSILLLGHIPNFYQKIILKGKIISKWRIVKTF